MTGTLGRLPGSVWTGNAEEVVARIITGWSPVGICSVCGEGRRPVVESSDAYKTMRAEVGDYNADARTESGGYAEDRGKNQVQSLTVPQEATITGYACACESPDAPITPAVVLDPFGNAGVSEVARTLGRYGISNTPQPTDKVR